MKKFLVLDDNPERHKEFARILSPHGKVFRADTANEAIAHLWDHVFDIVFLDHDLGEFDNSGYNSSNPGNGMDVVEFLTKMRKEDRPKFVSVVFVCSSFSWRETFSSRKGIIMAKKKLGLLRFESYKDCAGNKAIEIFSESNPMFRSAISFDVLESLGNLSGYELLELMDWAKKSLKR